MRKIKMTERDINRIINESVKMVLREDFGMGGELANVLIKNGLKRSAAVAVEDAITNVAGISDADLLSKIAQYIEEETMNSDMIETENDF